MLADICVITVLVLEIIFFKSKGKKETHERMHPAADKILKCEHCDDFLKLRCEKTRHEMTSHFAKPIENPQKCQYCQGIYTKEDLKRHNADQKCAYCKQSFNCAFQKQIHKKVLTKCDHCWKAFPCESAKKPHKQNFCLH